jgi:hypothetical protein
MMQAACVLRSSYAIPFASRTCILRAAHSNHELKGLGSADADDCFAGYLVRSDGVHGAIKRNAIAKPPLDIRWVPSASITPNKRMRPEVPQAKPEIDESSQ